MVSWYVISALTLTISLRAIVIWRTVYDGICGTVAYSSIVYASVHGTHSTRAWTNPRNPHLSSFCPRILSFIKTILWVRICINHPACWRGIWRRAGKEVCECCETDCGCVYIGSSRSWRWRYGIFFATKRIIVILIWLQDEVRFMRIRTHRHELLISPGTISVVLFFRVQAFSYWFRSSISTCCATKSSNDIVELWFPQANRPIVCFILYSLWFCKRFPGMLLLGSEVQIF